MKKLSVLLALLLVLGICLTGCQPQRMGVEEYLQRYATKLEWETESPTGRLVMRIIASF